jgi:hypothetical protein
LVEHLDGRKLVVSTRRGVVVAPKTVGVIPGEGMTSRSDPDERRSLFIEYSVIFSEAASFTDKFRAAVLAVVPRRDEAAGLDLAAEDVVRVATEEGDIGEFNNAQREKDPEG